MSKSAALIRAVALCAALAWSAVPGAMAAAGQACLDPGGIGGTGSPLHAGGMGGTGAPSAGRGVGGTGAPIGHGIGGTGAPATAGSGIGGTGAPSVGHGIGGTGAPASAGSGIGGTGAALAQAPGGIGGTGDPAFGGVGGTGIVGTITGFASICVNGAEVHYDGDVPVTENGVTADLGRLAVGQVVAVEAGPSGRGLEARRISILHALEGPLSALPSATAPMRVMGQPVRLASDARVAEALRLGEPVRVSGLRNAQGEVVATRVDRAPDLAEASAVGTVSATGELRGGLPLAGRTLAPGSEVLVRGRWNGAAIEVERAETDPSVPFAGRVRHALIEGLIHERTPDQLKLGDFSVTLEPGARVLGGDADDLQSGRRLRVSGEFRGTREIRASSIELMRVDLDMPRSDERRRDGDDDGDDKDLRTERESEERSDERRSRDREERSDRSGRRERAEKVERIEIDERPERIERSERIERNERVEKIERVERIERPEKD